MMRYQPGPPPDDGKATHVILTGHDPSVTLEGCDISGVDFLLQEWREGSKVTRELAVRPGQNRREITWGAPVALRTESQP